MVALSGCRAGVLLCCATAYMYACLLLPCGCCRGRDIVQQKKQELLELIKAEGLAPVGDVKL